MILECKHLPLIEFVSKAKAPIEHLFGCHTWCDSDWCWAKELDDATYKLMENSLRDSQPIVNPSTYAEIDDDDMDGDDQTEENDDDSSDGEDSESGSTLSDSVYSVDDNSIQTLDDELDCCENMTVEEIEECEYNSQNFDSYSNEDGIFSEVEMDKLRKREIELIQRKTSGYYRCKIRHAKLYVDMKNAYANYITPAMLK